MTPAVGDVIGFFDDRLLGAPNFKYHLCICSREGLYLLICSKQRTEDFPITDEECPLLQNEESYVSLSRIQQRRKIPRRYRGPHRVSDEFLQSLLDHVIRSKVVTPMDQRRISAPLREHLSTK